MGKLLFNILPVLCILEFNSLKDHMNNQHIVIYQVQYRQEFYFLHAIFCSSNDPHPDSDETPDCLGPWAPVQWAHWKRRTITDAIALICLNISAAIDIIATQTRVSDMLLERLSDKYQFFKMDRKLLTTVPQPMALF
jgi:hypothetical protein